METFSISKTVKDPIPRLPFLVLKEAVLGKRYNCSLVFIGDKRSKKLNEVYRGKEYIPNTLSFGLDDSSGEIFINLNEAKKQAQKRSESFDYYIALLFVHSSLHLKGMEHSDIMDEKMDQVLNKAGIYNTYQKQ